MAAVDDRVNQGRLRLLQAYIVRQEKDEPHGYAREAVDLLGEEDPLSATALLLLASRQLFRDLPGATATYYRVIQLAQREGDALVEVAALGDLLFLLQIQGRRLEAVAIVDESMARQVNDRGEPLPTAGLLLVLAGRLRYLANDLPTARRLIQGGLAIFRRYAWKAGIPIGMHALALAQQADGDFDAALDTIREARRLAEDSHDTAVAVQCVAVEAEFCLAAGRPEMAEQALSLVDLSGRLPTLPHDAAPYIAHTRLLLAQKRLGVARSRLATLEQWAEISGCRGYLVTLHILQTEADLMRSDHASASQHLSHAIELAAPQG